MKAKTKESLTCGESDFHKNIYQSELVEDPYLNMMLNNNECALFCREALIHFDELLEKYSLNAQVEQSQRLNLYLSLAESDRRFRNV